LEDEMRIHLISVDSEIYEDSYEEGEMGFTGCGLYGEHIGKTFPNMDSVLSFLAKEFNLSKNKNDYDIDDRGVTTSRMCADHSNAQNGGWFDPTEEELAMWRKGKLKLYCENFHFDYLKVV